MGTSEPWAFGLVGQVIERSLIVWVLKRMNGAVEEKVMGAFLALRQLHHTVHSRICCECVAQVMDRAASGYRVPNAAARAPRGDGLNEHGSGRRDGAP